MWSRYTNNAIYRGIPRYALINAGPRSADKGKTNLVNTTPPHWIKDGEVVTEELKAVVSELAKKLSSSSLDVQREGAEAFLSLINKVWTLETHAARDAADLIAVEIRYKVLLFAP